MKRLSKWLERRSSRSTFALGSALILLLGLGDYLTGPEVAFSVFYLLPVSLAEWKLGVARATVMAILAAFTWLGADIAADQTYGQIWIPAWNTLTRFAMFMIVIHLLANLRAALEAQGRLAALDSLTPALNPRAFTDAAVKAIEQSRARGRPFTLTYLDLDDFKSINDRLGHNGGDHALRLVGEALRSSVRASDIVGRLGGDEFAILFPDMGSSAATTAMDALVERVRQGVAQLPIDVTFSAGAATFLMAPSSMDDVISVSDELMYRAKRGGKNRYLHVVVGEGSQQAVPDETPARLA